MWEGIKFVGCCLSLSLLLTQPLEAQSWYFPDFALPSSSGEPASWIAGTYARGLNEYSGETNAVGAAFGKVSGSVAFQGVLGYITDDPGEVTAGASVGLDLNRGEGTRISAQGGIGWINFDFFDESVSFWRIPLGVAVKGSMGSEEEAIMPWVMPKVVVSFATGAGESDTETDFGASGGISFTTANGVGFHSALDALFVDDEVVLFLGVGVHYVLGRGN